MIESEKRFQFLVENSNDIIYTINLKGYFTYANVAAERITGWPQSEITGKNYLSLVRPDFHEKISAFYEKQYDDQIRNTYFEYPIIIRDGTTKWIGQNVQLLLVYGRITGFQAIARDITDLKKQEDSLRESEKKYRFLAEKMTDIVWIQDMNLRTVYVSPSIKTILGFTPEERMAQDVREQLTPESMSAALDLMARELALEQQGQADPERTLTIELEYYHKDGSTRWIENIISGIRDDQGALTGLHGVSRDISTRKQMDNMRKENEAFLNNYFENAPDGIYMSDMQGNFVYGNRRSEEIIGYSRDEMIGKNYLELNVLSVNSVNKAVRLLQANMEGKSTGPDELELVNKDGRHVPVEISTSVFERGGQKIALGFVRDITDRKRAERDLQNARDQLLQSEKLASVGRLSTGVAHEILNPVNIISMELQMLLMTEKLSPKVKEELQICMDQVSRIVTIAENLKQFSRVSEKKIITADINDVVANVLSLYATQLKIDGIKAEAQYEPDLPLTAMDREKIEQVIMNLITNAADAMKGKEKKVLTIRTEREKVSRKNGQLKIMIADTGVGIKTENMPKIFDPFFTTKEQGKGTGLGLSISYGIVHDHDGKIWAENNKEEGVSFYFTLPVKKNTGKITAETKG